MEKSSEKKQKCIRLRIQKRNKNASQNEWRVKNSVFFSCRMILLSSSNENKASESFQLFASFTVQLNCKAHSNADTVETTKMKRTQHSYQKKTVHNHACSSAASLFVSNEEWILSFVRVLLHIERSVCPHRRNGKSIRPFSILWYGKTAARCQAEQSYVM